MRSHSSVVARSNTILKQLVLQAKREHEAESIHSIRIYFAESHGGWRYSNSRHKRPMSSIVLNPGVKEMLLEDARDFLKSEKVRVIISEPNSLLNSSIAVVVRGSWDSFPARVPSSRVSRPQIRDS